MEAELKVLLHSEAEITFVIHHLGKAGEVLSALPMARYLKAKRSDCRIKWVVFDLYRDSIGNSDYIDEIEIVPTGDCHSLADIGTRMSLWRRDHFSRRRWIRRGNEIHIDAYYNYLLRRQGGEQGHSYSLNREPFYLQFYQNVLDLFGDDLLRSPWQMPQWRAEKSMVREAETFLAKYGVDELIVFSPVLADETCPVDKSAAYDSGVVEKVLAECGLPVLCIGTQWDSRCVVADGLDGYAPQLGLGALLYILSTNTRAVLTTNSGIGFAAHWLGVPLLMIDNRDNWAEQINTWKQQGTDIQDQAATGEIRWPPFNKERFKDSHMSKAPFLQISWDENTFRDAFKTLC